MLHDSLIIIRYGELSLKGGNRRFFEERLVANIKEKLNREMPGPPRVDESSRVEAGSFEYIKRISGRIIIKTKGNIQNSKFEILNSVFGIHSFSFASESSQDIKKLKKDCWDLVKEKFSTRGGSALGGKTFRVTTQRSNKSYPLTSQQLNEQVGAYIVKKLSSTASLAPSKGRGIKGEGMSRERVSLKNPDINCHIEIVEKYAFIYLEKIAGPGGMPVGTGGKALVLLSGGIDSPVAAYYLLKRGVRVDFIHFHSIPHTSPASVEKVKRLAGTLNKFQTGSKIIMVPFAETQREIMVGVPEKLRVIFYRRFMMMLAEKIAEKENYLALVTGESVGQVASQTLENMRAVEDAVSIPILRPLCGFDKEEIIEVAKKIGTFEISIEPHDDCCTRFIPKHPETRAKLAEIKSAEKNLETEKLIKKILEKMEIVAVT